MMKTPSVDLVLVVDASGSMAPCFVKLKQHLKDLLYPLQQARYQVRFGLVGYAAGKEGSRTVYDHTFVGGAGADMLRQLYSPQLNTRDFFTEVPDAIVGALEKLQARGDEDTLLALDIAADFPFAPSDSTQRVIALFTDEPLEEGITGSEPLRQLSQLIEKLMQRRIHLFASAPFSPALEQLASVDRAEIEIVEGGDGLKSVDFKKLLGQMGKSISISSRQFGSEPPWQRALYGQDRWDNSRSASDSNRNTVLAVGESARFITSKPITRLNVKLRWTAAVDLDLHAFCRDIHGSEFHIYFGNMSSRGIALDRDAGIGDVGGSNEENIAITSVPNFATILVATKIYKKGGRYSDYDAKVVVQTDEGGEMTVPLSSQERADWCVIARLTNTRADGVKVTNLNRISTSEPDLDDFRDD
jgi:uncharacterized protein involved in tellurium resistance